MKFNTNDVFDYYSSHDLDSLTLDSLGFDTLLNYSQLNPNHEISLKQINDMIVETSLYEMYGVDSLTGATIFSSSSFTWGSDLGCCGNYDFYCLYESISCLIHDFACYCCSEWHCFFCTSECLL